jgi:hypothetical protein
VPDLVATCQRTASALHRFGRIDVLNVGRRADDRVNQARLRVHADMRRPVLPVG